MKFVSSPNDLATQSFAERQVRYAAWRDRIMSRGQDEVIELTDDAPPRWSVEALYAGLPVD